MKGRTKIAIAAAGILTLAGGAAGIGVAASGGGDDEPPIPAGALEQATAAALAHTGGGRVTETEIGDEDSYYEVEVTFHDGRQVDVQLDTQFNVVSSEADDDSTEDDDDS